MTDSRIGGLPEVQPVADEYGAQTHVPDAAGAGAVLPFTVAAGTKFVIVDVDNSSGADTTTYRCRARLDGVDPTATTGFVCRSGQSTYLPFSVTGTVVKVFAPTGVTVAVQGLVRP